MWSRPLALLVCAWLTCAAGRSAGEEISLCADVWCPYNCKAGAARPGFAVEIAQKVFAGSGFRVTYHTLNWARCIEEARAGRFAGIIGAIPSDAPGFTFPAQPIGISRDGYAVRRGDPFQANDMHALDGRVLGTTSSYSFGGTIGSYIAAHARDSGRIEFVSGEDALRKNLAKLLARRVDVVLDDENVLGNAAAELGLNDRVTILRGPDADPVFIAFSPTLANRQALAARLDAGIIRLRRSGELATILAGYHLRNGS